MRLSKGDTITTYDPNGNPAEYTITQVEPVSHFTVEPSVFGSGEGFEEIRMVVHAKRILKEA